MVIGTKYDALELYREHVLPRVISKYDSENIINLFQRDCSWDAFIKYLCDKKLISPVTLKRWKVSSGWTSSYFLKNLHNLKMKDKVKEKRLRRWRQ